MVQGRLATLVGKPSGYIDSLTPAVKRRVEGLKGIQQDHAKIENEFQLEILELEKKVSGTFRRWRSAQPQQALVSCVHVS